MLDHWYERVPDGATATLGRPISLRNLSSLFPYPTPPLSSFFFFNDPAPTEFSPLSLHDALPICLLSLVLRFHKLVGQLIDCPLIAPKRRRLALRVKGLAKRASGARAQRLDSSFVRYAAISQGGSSA